MTSLVKNKPLFHKYLVKNLEDIRDKKIKQDYDWFQVISGKEGYGKSTLGVQICYLVDPTFNIDQICMDTDEFIKALKTSKRHQAVMLDEAGTVLYSREAMTNINRLLTKAFMVIRAKNLFVCIVLPSFFLLDSYIRNHRVNSLININRRGNFKIYSTKRTKILSIKGMKYKSYDVVKESYQGYFTKRFPNTELEKQYHTKKIKYVNRFLKDMQREREGFYKVRKFAEITGYTIRTIQRWIHNKEIKFKKIGGLIYIPKTEADRVAQGDVGDETFENENNDKPTT